MKHFLAIATAAACFIANPAHAETLNNGTIITLVKAGLGEATIIAKINGSANTFDLSTDQLIALKGQGLSDAIIAAMLGASTKARVSTIATAASDSPNPMDPHASGIYVLKSWNSPPKMEIIQPQTANYAKANMLGMAMTMGLAKAKLKSSFPGEKSAVGASTKRPEFYFYFETAATNLATMNQAARTPDDFVLMKFEVKKGNRLVFVGQGNRFGTRGLIREDGITVNVEKLSDYSYKLTPAVDLEPGEYGFVISAETGKGGNSAIAYTFSVL
jgi:hypothetical protein